jgi:signal transduction histidine kinase
MALTTLPPLADAYLATDVVAFTLFGTALFLAFVWRRDREPALGWFTAAAALVGLFATLNSGGLPTQGNPEPTLGLYLPHLALLCTSRGAIGYLAPPPLLRRWAHWLGLGPALLALALVTAMLAGLPFTRTWGYLLASVSLASQAGLFTWAAWREPGAGHGWVAVPACLLLVCTLALAWAPMDPLRLRYGGLLVVVALSLALMTALLLRRRHRLEAEVERRRAAESVLTSLNASLESSVADRTLRLRELVAGLESFNRSVSHDLRGSLSGIAGLAEMAAQALQRGDGQFARRGLPLIAQQAEEAADLVTALLSLARVGDAPVQCTPVNLQRVVGQVLEQLQHQLDPSGAPQFIVENMPQAWADAELLKPVLTNLIGNAVKFTRGTPGARVEVGAQAGAQAVTVHVRDNGVGFDAQAAANLFTPFVRLHGTGFDGHGVGLSIVRRAVERHGGRVWAQSQPGRGATFYFTLPKPWAGAAK